MNHELLYEELRNLKLEIKELREKIHLTSNDEKVKTKKHIAHLTSKYICLSAILNTKYGIK